MSRENDADWTNGGDRRYDSSSGFPGGNPRKGFNPSSYPRSSTRNADRFGRTRVNARLNCEDDMDFGTVSETDTSCVSLRYKRRAPCSKPLTAKARKPRCPARGPEPIDEPPPCRKKDEALGKRRKKLRPGDRRSPHRSDECATPFNVRVRCGVSTEDHERDAAMDRLSDEQSDAWENNWNDDDDCDSEYGSGNLSYQSDTRRREGGKRCASDKRRNMLKAKLRELLSETEPIPESCLLENPESKPEPEILAEVLLMSEAEGIDLADVQPDNVFDNLFADVNFDRSITIANAAPDSTMSDVVVPIQISGRESTPFEIPNIERVMEKTEGVLPPNLNAFQQSSGYDAFPSHMTELLDRTPATENVSEFLGSSVIENAEDGTRTTQDSMVDFVVKPGPSAHTNRIRLNGSTKPIWFPGYILVSPAIPGCIRMTDDPGEALKEAWRLCRPRNFDEPSRYIVNTG